jgi:hypothetical protein
VRASPPEWQRLAVERQPGRNNLYPRRRGGAAPACTLALPRLSTCNSRFAPGAAPAPMSAAGVGAPCGGGLEAASSRLSVLQSQWPGRVVWAATIRKSIRLGSHAAASFVGRSAAPTLPPGCGFKEICGSPAQPVFCKHLKRHFCAPPPFRFVRRVSCVTTTNLAEPIESVCTRVRLPLRTAARCGAGVLR